MNKFGNIVIKLKYLACLYLVWFTVFTLVLFSTYLWPLCKPHSMKREQSDDRFVIYSVDTESEAGKQGVF